MAGMVHDLSWATSMPDIPITSAIRPHAKSADVFALLLITIEGKG